MAQSFNAKKAAQVIAFFAAKSPLGQIDIIKVIKLVYLADRESFAKYGFPVLDDNYYSMPHGPVNSDTYRHVNGEVEVEGTAWAEYLTDKSDHKVGAVKAFTIDELDELSDADVECLDAVWRRFGHMGKWQLRDWTHEEKNVPEWEDPGTSSNPIPVERILRAVGVDNIDEQAKVIKDHRQLEKLFAALRG
jgi:uncharacterized phage-associated protein